MNATHPSIAALALTVLIQAPAAIADIVVTTDGSQLHGEILRVSEEKLEFKTEYAGTLEIPLEAIEHFTTEEAAAVRLDDGNVLVGQVASPEPGAIAVTTSGGVVQARTEDVAAVWAVDERDPDDVARETALQNQMRRWSYEAAVAIGGRSGNTTRSNIGVNLGATLEGPVDRLEIRGSYHYASEETGPSGQEVNRRSADEAVLAMSYTRFFSKHFGWYLREEIEYDTFENIAFRSTTAGGITYRIFDRPRHRLETRAGLAYRYESYYDLDFDGDGTVDLAEAEASSDNFPGLDFGLDHYWQFAEWGELNNTITYTPSINDLGDYLIDHRSAIDIPLGASDFWKLRLSLSNQYNSQPTGGREKLDTTYALSLLLKWK